MRIGPYSAFVKQDGPWWIGWIEDVPGINCREATREELIVSLEETLAVGLEFIRLDRIATQGRLS